MVADGLGGASGMLAWASSDPVNERLFWSSIYPKLLPLQIAGDPSNPITITWPVPASRVER